MKPQKQLPLLVVVVALVCIASCRRSVTPTDPITSTPTEGVERQHPEDGAPVVAETKVFKGLIGSALEVQMRLVREGENLNGSYFYQKVGKKIGLRGTVAKDGRLTLEEFDANGKQTGVFKGTWKPDKDGVVEIAGTWTKPNGDKQAAFSLHEEPIEFSRGVEIVSRQIKETNKKLKYEIDAQYPQLTGSVDPNFEKFNQNVRGVITKKVADFKQEMIPEAETKAETNTAGVLADEAQGSDMIIGYGVTLARDDLISIQFTVSSYSAGAAHPNSYTEVVNFDLKNGKPIKLADLFLPGSKYLETISTYSVQDLKKQGKAAGADSMLDEDWIQRGAGPELSNYENWTIKKTGLGITFDPYQVAAYAAGPQHVFVPYAALKGIIKGDGPVGQFVE